MKQKDLAIILAVAGVSAVISLILGHLIFAAPKNRQEKVEVVDAITTDFNVPDSKYFNASSINPTRLIQIGENLNNAPFSKSAQ